MGDVHPVKHKPENGQAGASSDEEHLHAVMSILQEWFCGGCDGRFMDQIEAGVLAKEVLAALECSHKPRC